MSGTPALNGGSVARRSAVHQRKSQEPDDEHAQLLQQEIPVHFLDGTGEPKRGDGQQQEQPVLRRSRLDVKRSKKSVHGVERDAFPRRPRAIGGPVPGDTRPHRRDRDGERPGSRQGRGSSKPDGAECHRVEDEGQRGRRSNDERPVLEGRRHPRGLDDPQRKREREEHTGEDHDVREARRGEAQEHAGDRHLNARRAVQPVGRDDRVGRPHRACGHPARAEQPPFARLAQRGGTGNHVVDHRQGHGEDQRDQANRQAPAAQIDVLHEGMEHQPDPNGGRYRQIRARGPRGARSMPALCVGHERPGGDQQDEPEEHVMERDEIARPREHFWPDELVVRERTVAEHAVRRRQEEEQRVGRARDGRDRGPADHRPAPPPARARRSRPRELPGCIASAAWAARAAPAASPRPSIRRPSRRCRSASFGSMVSASRYSASARSGRRSAS